MIRRALDSLSTKMTEEGFDPGKVCYSRESAIGFYFNLGIFEAGVVIYSSIIP